MAEFNFIEQLRLEGKAERTIEEYARRVRLWYQYLIDQGVADIMAATQDQVIDYQKQLLSQGLSVRTVNVKVSTISVYYEMALVRGLVTTNPVPKGIYIRTVDPNTPRLSDEALQQFEGWIDTLQDNVRAAFWCLYGTGARVGEVANLRHADVRLKSGAVYVNIRDAKWGSDREIPIMHAKAAKIVYEFAFAQYPTSKPLFRLSKRTIQGYATSFAHTTGIAFHCHVLRHTFATRLIEQGIPLAKVQFLLGHKSPAMTLHYTKNAEFDVTSFAPIVYAPKKERK